MFDKYKPFNLKFIQKASPNEGDAFDFAYIYKFFTDSTDNVQRLKYILRVEVFEDVFAIKFYAARDRKLTNKYNRILKVHNYKSIIKLFYTCATLVQVLHNMYPAMSFAINGAESREIANDKIEDMESNQRSRIYRNVALKLFGFESFEHFQCEEVSSYILINRRSCNDVDKKFDYIKRMFIERGFEV